MKLSKAQIKNYRSIKSQEIMFSPTCRILVGVNESGKSNVLRALSLLSEGKLPTEEDRRDPLQDEPLVTEAYVRFIFSLENIDRQEIFESIRQNIYIKNLDTSIITKGTDQYSFVKFLNTIKEGLYIVDVLEKTKSCTHWAFPKEYLVCEGWLKPLPACPPTQLVAGFDGIPKPLSQFSIIWSKDIQVSEIPESYLAPLTIKDIWKLLASEISRLVESKLPSCTFWEYSDSSLLPGKINLESFKNDPSVCIPLKHMFDLAGISDITKKIIDEEARPNGLRNLLRRVSERTTKHIRDVWKENKTVKVLLAENGPNIEAGIEDSSNVYSFSRRSDGFKRFITFLLVVSAKQRTKQLSDTLLLIDEPDIGLHPSGARYLRDELIQISGNNCVVFSTHSIFMIDRENIDRHLIVTKTDEVTVVTVADQSNIKEEEVIYNALGYSIFESLEKKNIIFEGWRDKKLFSVATSHPPTKHKEFKAKYEKVGVCHAKGAKDVTRITPLLELAGRDVLIVSDNDQTAIEQQKKYDGPGKWLLYSDIKDDIGAITGEDFVKPAAFRKALSDVINTNPDLMPLDEATLTTRGKLDVIKRWLAGGGIQGDLQKTILNKIKEDVFNNLKSSQIEDCYFDLLEKLADYCSD